LSLAAAAAPSGLGFRRGPVLEDFLGEVVARREPLFQVFGGDLVLDVDLAILDAAHVVVNDGLVILAANMLRALRMLEGFLHLHAFKSPDEVRCVLLRAPPGILDRLLDEEDALPRRPVMAAGDHPVGTGFASIDGVDAHQLAKLPIVRRVHVLEHTRHELKQIQTLRDTTDVLRGDRFVGAQHRVAVHRLVEPERRALGQKCHRLGTEEDGIELLRGLRHFGEVWQQVLGIERHGDGVVDLGAARSRP
jgi:hypothetical protein